MGLDVRSVISEWVAKQLIIEDEAPHFLIFPLELPQQPRPDYPDDVHAGKYMTATMHQHFSEVTDSDKAKSLMPTTLTYDDIREWTKGNDKTKQLTPSGYFGDPASYQDVDLDFITCYAKFAAPKIKAYLRSPSA